jgi:hypothetical protein
MKVLYDGHSRGFEGRGSKSVGCQNSFKRNGSVKGHWQYGEGGVRMIKKVGREGASGTMIPDMRPG